MCAIAGILNAARNFSKEEMARLLRAMAASMAHRGPDHDGLWISGDGRCGFAHRRLSVIDTSEAGAQPLSGGDGRTWITFNGEIYNYRELRSELEARGCRFRTKTDTEVLSECVRVFGADAFMKLDGMYAFGWFDERSGELLLARDPFGEKPLYYTWIGGSLCFASELKALQRLPGFDATVEESVLAEYLAFQYINAPRTIYRGAFKLPPAHFLRVRSDGRMFLRRYFEFLPGKDGDSSRSLDELADELEGILTRSLERRLISDVPLGAFLSGGVDSSLAVGLIHKRLGREIATFSIGFEGAEESEHEQAREMARHFGVDHHDRILKPDALELLERLGRVLDEPNGDSSCLPTYLLSSFAREKVTVAISGDGGDELFAGYRRYFDTLEEEALEKREGIQGEGWRPGTAYYSSRILIFDDPALEQLLGSLPSGLRQRLSYLRSELNISSTGLLHRLRKTDVEHYLPGAVLPKVDRMSMQHALEVRTPFLSLEVAAFASRLGADALYGEGQGKLVLKRLGARFIPEAWLRRRKQGFGLPVGIWAGKILLDAAREYLLDGGSRLQRWISPSRLERYLKRQDDPSFFNAYQIWALLILEIYLRENAGAQAAIEPRADDAMVLHHLLERQQAVTVFTSAPEPPWLDALPPGSKAVGRSPAQGEGKIPRVVADWSAATLDEAAKKRISEAIAPGVVLIWNHDMVPDELADVLRNSRAEEVICSQAGIWLKKPVRLLSASPIEGARFHRLLEKLRLSARDLRSFSAKNPRERNLFPLLGGHAYRASFSGASGHGTKGNGRGMDVLLFEDGRPLCGPAALRTDVLRVGKGRYCQQNGSIIFSSSDNTDPNSNRRDYRACAGPGIRPVVDRLRLMLPPYQLRSDSPFFTWDCLQDADQGSLAYFEKLLRAGIQHENRLNGFPVLNPANLGRICLVIGHLGTGGAERQACNLAMELSRRGHDVVLLVTEVIEGGAGHYRFLLEEAGVSLVEAGILSSRFDFSASCARLPSHRRSVLAGLPREFKERIWALYTHLSALRPTVVHAFLDYPNILAGIAGWLAGVGRVALSLRNVNPTHFHFNHPAFRPCYLGLAEARQVRFAGNSNAGNNDYASWLGLSPERFHLTRNGLCADHLVRASVEERREFRRELGIANDSPVVCGVFRLQDEKEPMIFLRALEGLMRRMAEVRAVIAGEGPLEGLMREFIRRRGLDGKIILLGRRRDVARIMSSSDVLLLASSKEGTPNVALEAQYLAVPVVATDVGGTREAMVDGKTGYLCPSGRVDELAACCERLLKDKNRRMAMGEAGRRFMEEHYLLEKAVESTLAVYASPS